MLQRHSPLRIFSGSSRIYHTWEGVLKRAVIQFFRSAKRLMDSLNVKGIQIANYG
jgi:hypothetical protein